ncbi:MULTISPECIES: efflux transporter outer membrane subunit [unclassified Novosphingobium]|uniref:efflux transporter outer membrane subunit n=1 Tax=Novosphingobium TaxID=165696 RepID=UPI00146F5B94|nr:MULTISPECIES: efflux transporter outer membrane subunit [unclassified Novosphingobium]NMN07218.1 NodT family efflux transporter outer membrane factor (OMF) lipoprotein [Novosphingobium sp. SG919]NMN89194.1 NodT family efflux transporter outer membrane factor (OMF) lipoprotein [Novosphingobium sp. SG916]
MIAQTLRGSRLGPVLGTALATLAAAQIVAVPLASAKAPPATASVDVPLPPTPTGYAPAKVLDQPMQQGNAGAQQVHAGMAVSAQWWEAFGSPALNALVARALAANTDLAAARARMAQAQALAGAARGGLLPQVDAGLTSERQRLSATLSTPLADPNPQVFSLHTAQVSVSYAPDLFGGGAARLRSARAAAAQAQAQADGVRNMVAANVVLEVIRHAALTAEIEATREAIDSNQQVLGLLRQREKVGAAGRADVTAQAAAVAAVEGALPPLKQQHAANLAALSVLLGEAPGAPLETAPGVKSAPLPTLDELAVPADVPLVLPADLLVVRPDVAASAAALEGAAADVKVAMAARLPQINLSATAGGTAEDFGRMFVDGNPFWQLLGGITAPIFHGGTLKRQEQAARDALDAAKAGYKGTALQAFADVSNALSALANDTAALDVAQRGDDAAASSLIMVKRQLELGAVGTLQVLNASATAQTARAQFVAARAARLADTVGLFTALGGGVRQLPTGPAGPAPVASGH